MSQSAASRQVSRRDFLEATARRMGEASFATMGVAFCEGNAFGGQASQEVVLRPRATEGLIVNPLKGWCTYTHAGEIHQPYSLVFRYVSWRELEPEEGDFQFESWEKKSWEDPKAKGRHILLRVYADYPRRPSGVPDWLLKRGVKVTRYSDYGGGLSPDYNDPVMVKAMERLLAALGARYDKHPRIAFIQLGLLGFWGEWHTYPRNELFANETTQRRIIDAYHAAFPNKKLMCRNANHYAGQQDWLGYHDDMFPEDTDGPEAWQFLPNLRKAGRAENWKRAVIGGEMVPNAAKKWLGAEFERTMQRLEQAHFTWVGPYSPALEKPTPEFGARCCQMVRRMGYEFRLTEIRHPTEIKSGRPFRFSLEGVNQGVAPFYYPWPVEIGLWKEAMDRPLILSLLCDIRSWLPGKFTLTKTVTASAAPGTYRLRLRVRDPYQDSMAPLRFANDLETTDGWTELSTIKIL